MSKMRTPLFYNIPQLQQLFSIWGWFLELQRHVLSDQKNNFACLLAFEKWFKMNQ